MALVIPQFTFALIASLALQEIFYGKLEQNALLKKLKYAAIACGAVFVTFGSLFLLFIYEWKKQAGKKCIKSLNLWKNKNKLFKLRDNLKQLKYLEM